MPSGSTTSSLLPAYLIVGEDALKRRTVIERLRNRVSTLGDLEFNHDEFNAENASGEEIVQALDTLPFASELRLVEVSSIDKASKQCLDALVEYLVKPNDSSILAISGIKLAKNTRLYKAVSALGSQAIVDCAPMKRGELPRALRSMAVGHGITLTQPGAEKLIELVGQDTVALDSELAKLATAHTGEDPVTDREVAALVARTAQAKPWELVDAFSARDARQCSVLLGLLDSVSPYALIGMCVARLRELACAQSLIERGETASLAAVLKAPAWRVKNHTAWARKFSRRELEHSFSTARDCEQAMKSGANADEAFKEWLFATISKN